MSTGRVLVDNTSLFGASRALSMWPPRPEDWQIGKNAVDLRSLMDMLEALVLHDQIIADGSSRDGALAFPELSSKTDLSVFSEQDLFLEPDDLQEIVLNESVNRLRQAIQNGRLESERKKIGALNVPYVLPQIYSSPQEFYRLTDQTADLVPEVRRRELLRALCAELESQTQSLATYGMFIFRGLYYRELANLLSISYLPHCWRAPYIATEAHRREYNFAGYALGLSSQLRDELSRSLNSEFGVDLYALNFPPLASFIVSQASRRDEILDIALEVRATREAQKFRKWVGRLQDALWEQDNPREVREGVMELADLFDGLRKQFGLPRANQTHHTDDGIPVTVKLQVPLGILSASTETKIPWKWKRIFRRRTHLLFLRHITAKSADLRPFVETYTRLAR